MTIDLTPFRPTLRVVTEADQAPVTDNATAQAEIQGHWNAARRVYSELLGSIAPLNLRWLIDRTDMPGLVRGHFVGMAREARSIATKATALADHLDHAVSVYDRWSPR